MLSAIDHRLDGASNTEIVDEHMDPVNLDRDTKALRSAADSVMTKASTIATLSVRGEDINRVGQSEEPAFKWITTDGVEMHTEHPFTTTGSEFGVPLEQSRRNQIEHWILSPLPNHGTTEESSNSTKMQDLRCIFSGTIKNPETEMIEAMNEIFYDSADETVDDDLDGLAAQSLFNKGDVFFSKADFGAAVDRYRSGLQKASNSRSSKLGPAAIKEVKFKLAVSCYHIGSFEEGEHLFLEIASEPISNITDAKRNLDALHNLAAIDLKLQNYDAGIIHCQQSLDARRRIKSIGTRHPYYYSSLRLLAVICWAKGDSIDAETYASLLPDVQKVEREDLERIARSDVEPSVTCLHVDSVGSVHMRSLSTPPIVNESAAQSPSVLEISRTDPDSLWAQNIAAELDLRFESASTPSSSASPPRTTFQEPTVRNLDPDQRESLQISSPNIDQAIHAEQSQMESPTAITVEKSTIEDHNLSPFILVLASNPDNEEYTGIEPISPAEYRTGQVKGSALNPTDLSPNHSCIQPRADPLLAEVSTDTAPTCSYNKACEKSRNAQIEAELTRNAKFPASPANRENPSAKQKVGPAQKKKQQRKSKYEDYTTNFVQNDRDPWACYRLPKLKITEDQLRSTDTDIADARIWLAKRGSKSILNLISDSEKKYNQMMLAVVHGEIHVVKLLLMNPRLNVNKLLKNPVVEGSHYMTPLHAAVINGHLNICAVLLNLNADVNREDGRGITPVMYAALHGNHRLCQLLLNKGANLEARQSDKLPPLVEAARRGHAKLCLLLLKHGADVNQGNPDRDTPLIAATIGAHVDTCEVLLGHNANPEMPDRLSCAPLYHAASFGHTEVCRLLLDKGANLETPNRGGWGPLHIAAYKGHEAVCRLLLERGANPEKPEDTDWTPLHIAADCGHAATCRLLLEKGVNIETPNDYGWTPLHIAVRWGHAAICQLLIEKGANLETLNDKGWAPLHTAAQYGHTKVCQLLLKNGANLEIVDSTFNSCPLTSAARSGSRETIQVFLEYLASLEAEDRDGDTALGWAAAAGKLDACRFLIEKGANVYHKNKGGKTLAMVAKTDEVRNLLLNWKPGLPVASQ